MILRNALKYAEWWTEFLKPHAETLIVAGSIRRERPVCNDIDIVCVPKTTVEQVSSGDLFNPVAQQRRNLCYEALMDLAVQQGFKWKGRSATTPPPQPGCMYMWVVTSKSELDLWFADSATLATRLICRTGSKEHNIWIAKRAERMGLKWKPYEGLFDTRALVDASPPPGELISTATEADFYRALGLDFIEPRNRELEWLIKHIGRE